MSGDNLDDPSFNSTYVLQSPESLLKTKFGVCWDHVEFQRYFFNKMRISNKSVFIEIDNVKNPDNYPSHTTSIIYIMNKPYWFENSYGSYRGIHGPYKDEDVLIDFVEQRMTDDLKHYVENYSKNAKYKHKFYVKPKYGISVREFYLHVGFIPPWEV